MGEADLPDIPILPIIAACIFLEIAVSRVRNTPVHTWADSGLNLFIMVMNMIVLPVSFYGIMTWLYQYRIVEIGIGAWSFAALYVLQDFLYYWSHRLSHRCRLAWASHSVHHSSPHFNLLTSWRVDSFGGPFASWIYWLPTCLIGFPPDLLLYIYSIKVLYANLCHTQMVGKLPRWYEFIFNTPAHHRVHHGNNEQYVDKNYGSTFIVWDRLFGTFAAEQPDVPVVYGLTKQINSNNALTVIFKEWIDLARDVGSARRWSAAAKHIFLPPAAASSFGEKGWR